MNYQCAVFDLDGTLANTLPSIAYFANQALAHYGLPLIPQEKYRYLVGNGADCLVHGMLQYINNDTDQMFQQVRLLYNQTYDENFLYLTSAYDGIQEVISFLKTQNFSLGVLSNKPHSTTVKIVEKLFPNQFDICYGKRENIPRKPNPTALLDILNTFQVSPRQCFYIGDTSTDMKTGKNAGAFTIGCGWGFRDHKELEENHADYIADTPLALLTYFKQML